MVSQWSSTRSNWWPTWSSKEEIKIEAVASATSPAQKVGGLNNFSLLVTNIVTIYIHGTPMPTSTENFSTDSGANLKRGLNASGGPNPPIHPWRRY